MSWEKETKQYTRCSCGASGLGWGPGECPNCKDDDPCMSKRPFIIQQIRDNETEHNDKKEEKE